MAIDKPTKPTNEFLPNGFGTGLGVVKNDFSDNKKINGFSANLEDILQGDNLNYMLDTIGKQLKYLTTVVDYINNISVLKVPFINGNNKLDFTDINGLLPSQNGNNGKYLSTNGTTCNWSNDFIKIGEPQFTLNFTQILPNNCTWLDGTGGDRGDGTAPITGEWATLFAIYGYTYDTSLIGNERFKLPNFTGRAIWGGINAGYINAGLPNITAEGIFTSTKITRAASTYNNSFYKGALKLTDINENKPDVDNDAQGTNGGTVTFDASRSSKIYGGSSTVQPPAIKVRVYTRYK